MENFPFPTPRRWTILISPFQHLLDYSEWMAPVSLESYQVVGGLFPSSLRYSLVAKNVNKQSLNCIYVTKAAVGIRTSVNLCPSSLVCWWLLIIYAFVCENAAIRPRQASVTVTAVLSVRAIVTHIKAIRSTVQSAGSMSCLCSPSRIVYK